MPSEKPFSTIECEKGFSNLLSALSLSNPQASITTVSNTWLKLSGAHWLGIWGLVPVAEDNGGDEYLLQLVKTAVAPSLELDLQMVFAEVAESDDGLVPQGRGSAAEFALRAQRPITIADVRTWEQRTSDANIYHVQLCESLATIEHPNGEQIVSMLCVPCIPASTAEKHLSKPDPTTAEFVVTLHYTQSAFDSSGVIDDRHKNMIIPRVEKNLEWLGHLTYAVISHQALLHRSRLVTQLNRLASQYISDFATRPLHLRERYVDSLIHLISRELGYKSIQLYWRDLGSQGSLVCIGSSDQSDSQAIGTQAGPTDQNIITTHQRGVLFNRIIRRGERPPSLYVPFRVDDPAVPQGSPRPKSQQETFGVMRCSDPAFAAEPGLRRRFDARDPAIATLIAQQVTPVLQSLEQRIVRETAVAVVRHDIDAPSDSIEQMAIELEDLLERHQIGLLGNQNVHHLIGNIKYSAQRLRHMKDILELDYRQLRLDETSGVRLVADILAPLKRSMWYFMSKRSNMELIYQLTVSSSSKLSLPSVRHTSSQKGQCDVVMNVDEALLTRLLMNLITNAVKYGTRGSTIVVNIRVGPRVVAIDVSNDGEGVEQGQDENIFRPFFRLGSSHVISQEGSGLGLSISRNIAELHGGAIRLLRRKDPTTFRIELPLSRVEEIIYASKSSQ